MADKRRSKRSSAFARTSRHTATTAPQEDVIVVPLSTLLLFDESLRPFVELAVGKGLRREPGGAWRTR
jgi:hypothetical protein